MLCVWTVALTKTFGRPKPIELEINVNNTSWGNRATTQQLTDFTSTIYGE